MITGITFDTREAAVEYRDRKHEEGYTAEVNYDTNTGKYRVTVGTGLVTLPEEEFPETPGEIIEAEKKQEEAQEKIEAGLAVRAGMVCYGAKGTTKKSCLIAGGNWITATEARALKAEAKAVEKYTPTRPPTLREREAARRAERFGPKGLLRKPPEDIPERLVGAAAGEGERILGSISRRMSPKAGLKRAVPRTTIPSTPAVMPDSIGADGRMPRIMLVPKAPGIGKIPTPTGIPYLKNPKEEKDREE